MYNAASWREDFDNHSSLKYFKNITEFNKFLSTCKFFQPTPRLRTKAYNWSQSSRWLLF